MSRRAAACEKCTSQCVTVHQNDNSSSAAVNGFFKIMYGKDCSKFLSLPPKFARTVQHLVGQEVELEDSRGNKWHVTFSNLSGFLSLNNGWPKFFTEHNLESGNVLVFNCIKEDHFIVHIYDKSACRVYDFSPKRPQKKKRCKSNPILADEEDISQSVEKNSKHKSNLNTQYVPASQISNGHINVMGNIVPEVVENLQTVSTCKILVEDPICMLNRDSDYLVEDRNYLHDLSFFEMKKTTLVANDLKKNVEGTSAPRDDTEMSDVFVTHQIHEEPSDYGSCHDLSNFEVKKTASDANDFGKILEETITHNDDTEMIEGIFTDQSNEEPSGNANFIISMQSDVNLSQNEVGGGILTSVADSRFISSGHVLERNFTNTEQISSTEKEPVESREGKAITREFLPDTNDQYLRSNFNNIPPAEQFFSIKKEVVESGVSLPITSSPLVSSMLNITPAAHVSSIKKELVESREKDKALTHVSQPIISTQLLCSMLNIGPAKRSSSSTKELVELRDKGQAPTHVSLPKISTHRLSSMLNTEPAAGDLLTTSLQTSSPAVKIEPGILYDTVPPVATTSFSAQVKSLNYLELPVCIPLSVQEKGDMVQGQVVFLRDPSGKLWPVLHPDLFCVKAFTGNWRDFCEANNVKPGDICQFQLESYDSSSCIYRVDVQKSGQ